MLGYIDWIIILIALMAAIGAVLLLLPQSGNRETQQLRVVRLQAENDRKRVSEVLEITEHGAKDAEDLLTQLKDQIEESNRSYQASQARAEQAERIIERVNAAENEIRDISTQLGERLQHLQGYWDEQLGDSVESVKRIRSKLHEGLTQVDDSLTRLREQEQMAQGFTRRLLDSHQEQVQKHQENAQLSAEVHDRLEHMLQESGDLMSRMKRYQQDADAVFQAFNTDMEALGSQANEHFSTLFQTTDLARHELNTGLEESRKHVETMRRREEQSNDLSRQIQQQFEQVDHIRVERIARTLDLTEQMSSDLHKGMENARDLLSSLEVAVQNVTHSLDEKTKQVNEAQEERADHTNLIDLMQEQKSEPKSKETDKDQTTEATSSNASEVATEAQEAEKLTQLTEKQTESDKEEPTAHNLLALRAYR